MHVCMCYIYIYAYVRCIYINIYTYTVCIHIYIYIHIHKLEYIICMLFTGAEIVFVMLIKLLGACLFPADFKWCDSEQFCSNLVILAHSAP